MSFEFISIDHIQLAAPPASEEAAREFFGEVLGLEELPKPEELAKRGGVWFLMGDKQIHIGIQKDFVPAKKAHPAFEIKNLGHLKSRIEDYDIETIDDEALEGADRFYVHDPFGNRLEFLEWRDRI